MKRTPGQRAFEKAMQITCQPRKWDEITSIIRNEWEAIAKAVNDPDPMTLGEIAYCTFHEGYSTLEENQKAYSAGNNATNARWEAVGKKLDTDGYERGFEAGQDNINDPDW